MGTKLRWALARREVAVAPGRRVELPAEHRAELPAVHRVEPRAVHLEEVARQVVPEDPVEVRADREVRSWARLEKIS